MDNTEAVLAISLIRVLTWPYPDGSILRDRLPHWLVERCDTAINKVPQCVIKSEIVDNPLDYPPEMCKIIKTYKHNNG